MSDTAFVSKPVVKEGITDIAECVNSMGWSTGTLTCADTDDIRLPCFSNCFSILGNSRRHHINCLVSKNCSTVLKDFTHQIDLQTASHSSTLVPRLLEIAIPAFATMTSSLPKSSTTLATTFRHLIRSEILNRWPERFPCRQLFRLLHGLSLGRACILRWRQLRPLHHDRTTDTFSGTGDDNNASPVELFEDIVRPEGTGFGPRRGLGFFRGSSIILVVIDL